MNLTMNPSLAIGLKNQSQVARRVTEAWAANNLFCLACSSEKLTAEKPNTRVRGLHLSRVRDCLPTEGQSWTARQYDN